ncbi:hypothetical protein KHQ88_05650 [Mycoplasmatota bacterium]|nr:hypothetical protein KHQ88_05650 [Mycoplasmatota bacterium]
MMNHKRQIVKSLLIIIIILLVSVTGTLAWISYSGLADGGSVSAGAIDYTTGGSLVSDGTAINPHKELILEDIFVNNQSTINTQIRLKVYYTILEDDIPNQKLYQNDLFDVLIIEFHSPFVFDSNDGYWYYPSKTGSLSAKSGKLVIMNSMYYDGFKVSNEYVNIPITISVILQAKQTNHISWEDLTSYDFNTGKPTT